MLYFLLINVKIPTIVGILTFMSRKNFMLNRVEHEKSFIISGPGLSGARAMGAHATLFVLSCCGTIHDICSCMPFFQALSLV